MRKSNPVRYQPWRTAPADAGVRLRAAQSMVEMDGVAAVGALIDLLAANAPLMIEPEASGTLRERSGQNFGFDPTRALDEQREAIASWGAWLKTSFPEGQ